MGITARTEVYRETVGRFRLAWLAMQERSPSTQEERFGQEELQEKAQETRGPGPFPTLNLCDEGEEGRCFHCGGVYVPEHRCLEIFFRIITCAKEKRVPAKVNQGILGQIEENLEDKKRRGSVNRWIYPSFLLGSSTT